MGRFRHERIPAVAGLLLLFVLVAAAGGKHAVGPGDTLSAIAWIHGISTADLARHNNLPNPDMIFPGQVIEIPAPPGETAIQTERPQTHVVQPGDTLSAISVRYGVSIQDIQAANQLSNPHLIVIGTELSVQRVQPTPAPTPLPVAPPSDPRLEPIIEELAAAYGIDPGLVKAIAWLESGWNQGAVSPRGASGVMQLMPGTIEWLEHEVFGYELNEDVSVYDNVKAGVRLLRILMDAHGGDVDKALASYYQGYALTAQGILYRETVDYLAAVHAVKARFWP